MNNLTCCFDIDGVINIIRGMDYKHYVPNEKVIEKINTLYDAGCDIVLFTGRGSKSRKDWGELTKQQLKDWGVKYHELIFGKPHFNFFVDDRAISILDFCRKPNVVVALIGGKGVGKTEARNIFETFGFSPVFNEKKYLEFGDLYPALDINQEDKIQDFIYKDIEAEIIQKAFRGNVVYEATGGNERWPILIGNIAKLFRVVVVKVKCQDAIARRRLRVRNGENNYPASDKHIEDIIRRLNGIESDFTIENDDSLPSLEFSVSKVIKTFLGKKIVAVSGGFDPVHIGHLELFQAARSLGDELVVLLNSDRFLMEKKGYVFMPYMERKKIIESIKFVDSVQEVVDLDDTVRETLKIVRPNIFAVGGDRTGKTHKEVCEQIGCEVIAGVGGGKIQSSSWLVEKRNKSKIVNAKD